MTNEHNDIEPIEFNCDCEEKCGNVLKIFKDNMKNGRIELVISTVFNKIEENKWKHNIVIKEDRLSEALR